MTLEKQPRSETTVDVRRLPGLTPYAEAWDLQKDLVRLRKNEGIPDTFVLCEHPPVYTIGRAAEDTGNLGAGEEYLRALGAEVSGAIGEGMRPSTVLVRSWRTRSCASRCVTPTPTSANSKDSSSGFSQTADSKAGTILNTRVCG